MILHAFLLFSLIVNSYGESIGVFNDNVLFEISWPGFIPKNDALEVHSKVEVRIFENYAKIYPSGFYYRRMRMQTSRMAIPSH